MTASEAFAAYQSAEAVWQASLVAAYGADAGDARYQVRGSMVEGYAEYCKAGNAWRLAMAHARDNGASCTCRFETVDSASDDPPEMIVDRNCPVHGTADPDAALDAERDDADFPFYTEDCA